MTIIEKIIGNTQEQNITYEKIKDELLIQEIFMINEIANHIKKVTDYEIIMKFENKRVSLKFKNKDSENILNFVQVATVFSEKIFNDFYNHLNILSKYDKKFEIDTYFFTSEFNNKIIPFDDERKWITPFLITNEYSNEYIKKIKSIILEKIISAKLENKKNYHKHSNKKI